MSKWDIELEQVDDIARVARKVAYRYRTQGASAEDLEQEGRIWMATHADTIEAHEADPDKGWPYTLWAIESHMGHVVKRSSLYGVALTPPYEGWSDEERDPSAGAFRLGDGGEAENHCDYTPARRNAGGAYCITYRHDEVTALIPGIWSVDTSIYGAERETHVSPDMPKGQGPNPAHGNQAAAKVADIQRAWAHAGLTPTQRRNVVLVYGLGMSAAEAGRLTGVSRKVANASAAVGIEKMLAYLNGRPSPSEDEAA